MEKTYSPGAIEQKWYKIWENEALFAADLDSQQTPYCIVIPPPNVTGTLHMGHAFQDTVMDILTRYHRMMGQPTLWQPGTDHAGIATQMVVERQLNSENTTREALGREKFIEKVWEWKEHSGGEITNQLRRLGASVDWQRERFTMDEGLSAAVTDVFVQLYDEGLIYRGKRLVNWDPVFHTALSDLEVLPEEDDGHLWHFKYPIKDSSEFVTVATTRPETMLGDTAVAVHPDDTRYQHLIGKVVLLPLANREIPVVADEYVDPDFGSGCVKITPAHDFNDYEIGLRHDLPMISIMDKNAQLNDQVPQKYAGLDRFDARKLIVEDLDKLSLLAKTEAHKLSVPRGDRSGAIVEPLLTEQWYVKIDPLAKPAIQAVENGDIKFVPENWSKTYFEWMYNIQDWCISRQLWWGHRIPAWYDESGNQYVAATESEVREKYGLSNQISLTQDEDVLDTWFSSALWPFSTLGWPEKTTELKLFYPTSVLVTGFDIIFFWVARMIMMGLKFAGDVPFKEVYIHGLVRDADGQKMSKSKGNVLDPVDLISGIDLESLVRKRTKGLMQPHLRPKIEKATRRQYPDGINAFGTDALRFTFAALATTGRDIRFDLGRIDGYHKFCNKLWQASRFVFSHIEQHEFKGIAENRSVVDRWIISRCGRMIESVHSHFSQYRFDLAAKEIYEFTWHEFCDWYLELSKPVLMKDDYTLQQKDASRDTLRLVLDSLLRVLHPIMPFITEEIWQGLATGSDDRLMTQRYPEAKDYPKSPEAEEDVRWVKEFSLGIRQIRGEMNISPGRKLDILLQDASPQDQARLESYGGLLASVARIEAVRMCGQNEQAPPSATALLGDMKILVPMSGLIDAAAEIERLNKRIEKLQKDRSKSMAKLENPNFVERAPKELVDQERTRVAEFDQALDKLADQVNTHKELL